MMGISVTKLLIILAIIIVVFGTKRLRNLGTDLGETIKGFRNSLKEGEKDGADNKTDSDSKDSDKAKITESNTDKIKDKT